MCDFTQRGHQAALQPTPPVAPDAMQLDPQGGLCAQDTSLSRTMVTWASHCLSPGFGSRASMATLGRAALDTCRLVMGGKVQVRGTEPRAFLVSTRSATQHPQTQRLCSLGLTAVSSDRAVPQGLAVLVLASLPRGHSASLLWGAPDLPSDQEDRGCPQGQYLGRAKSGGRYAMFS